MDITIGSWVLPLVVTIAAFVIANILVPAPKPSSYMPDPIPALAFLAFNALASIASLIAWLIWSLF